MDQCPHCGEPIEEDDESCRHCGSDFETGWKPDADYYELDLPDNELQTDSGFRDKNAQPVWQAAMGWALVGIAAMLFLAASFIAFPKSFMPFAFVVALMASWILFHRKVSLKKKKPIG